MIRIFKPKVTQSTQAPSPSGGASSSSTPAPAPQARQRSASFPLQTLKAAGRALGLVSAPKIPTVQAKRPALVELMHQDGPSKLTRTRLGVPLPGDSAPSSPEVSRESSPTASRRASFAEQGEFLAREGGQVRFAAQVKQHIKNESAIEASQRNGTEELTFTSELRQADGHAQKPHRRANVNETRAGLTGAREIQAGQMVNILKQYMYGANADPDEAAEIREALAAHVFPECMVYEAQYVGLTTEDSRAAVVARFHEWAEDDMELAKDAQYEHPVAGEAH